MDVGFGVGGESQRNFLPNATPSLLLIGTLLANDRGKRTEELGFVETSFWDGPLHFMTHLPNILFEDRERQASILFLLQKQYLPTGEDMIYMCMYESLSQFIIPLSISLTVCLNFLEERIRLESESESEYADDSNLIFLTKAYFYYCRIHVGKRAQSCS
jgi:hypothetical protein